jgi:hypothetical protein
MRERCEGLQRRTFCVKGFVGNEGEFGNSCEALKAPVDVGRGLVVAARVMRHVPTHETFAPSVRQSIVVTPALPVVTNANESK